MGRCEVFPFTGAPDKLSDCEEDFACLVWARFSAKEVPFKMFFPVCKNLLLFCWKHQMKPLFAYLVELFYVVTLWASVISSWPWKQPGIMIFITEKILVKNLLSEKNSGLGCSKPD